MKSISSTIEILESRNLFAGAEVEIGSADEIHDINYVDSNIATNNPTSNDPNSIPESFFELIDDGDLNEAPEKNNITELFEFLGVEDTGHIKNALGYIASTFQSAGELCSSIGSTSSILELAKPSGFSKRSWGVTLGAAGEVLFKVGTGLEEVTQMIPAHTNSK